MVDTFCTHPLALLKITTTQPITEFTKRNYVKTQDQINAVDKEFDRYIVEGHMVPATEHPQACFAYPSTTTLASLPVTVLALT